jgi:hypothetical protein
MSFEELDLAFPLHTAAHRGDLSTIRTLLKNTDVDERATGGATPLHAAGAQPFQCDAVCLWPVLNSTDGSVQTSQRLRLTTLVKAESH